MFSERTCDVNTMYNSLFWHQMPQISQFRTGFIIFVTPHEKNIADNIIVTHIELTFSVNSCSIVPN